MAITVVTNLFALVLVLGFLIFAHEAGHFFVAKAFRVRVLVFSFGFGRRLFGFRMGDTDYRVSAIPLGGYVRMAGDIPDENHPSDPHEFLSKPKWQRFLILVAGPAMNLIIAVGFVAGLSMIGTEIAIVKPILGEVQPNLPAAKAGLQAGDEIVSINGEKIEDFDDLRLAITMHADTPVSVVYRRQGAVHTTTMTPVQAESDYGPVGRAGVLPLIVAEIGRVVPGSPADRAGLQRGDRIITANGQPAAQLQQFNAIVEASKGAPIALRLQRGASVVSTTLGRVAGLDDKDPYRGFYPPSVIHKLSLFPAIQDGIQQNWKMLRYTGQAVVRIFRAQGSVKEFSGPISIARISGDMFRRGWMEFISLMAMISLQLGIMNLLPIPILDGGHIAVLLVEGAARRDLSMMAKERIQQIGFALLATLMIVVLYNDVVQNVMRIHHG